MSDRSRFLRALATIDTPYVVVEVVLTLATVVVGLLDLAGWVEMGVALQTSGLLLILSLAVLFWVAPWKLAALLDADLERLTATPPVRLDLRKPYRLPSGSEMVRVDVTQEGERAETFVATVVDTSGIPSTGPEHPWYIPWRHSRERTAQTPAERP